MNFLRRRFEFLIRLVLITSIGMLSACASSEYWVPPSAPPTSPPELALAESAPIPDLVSPVDLPDQLTPIVEITPSNTQDSLPVAPELVTPQTNQDLITQPSQTPNTETADSEYILYHAQAADTLPVLATRFGVQPEEITSPDPIPNSAYLTPGQLLVIPNRLTQTTSPDHIMPDSEVVYSPTATDFDITTFVNQAGGKLSTYSDWLKSTGISSGAEIVQRVAIENSINPRLLLSLLEYHSGWVYGQPTDRTAIDYPMGYVDRDEKGLYHQLVWAVNQLSIGYYAYREGRMSAIEFPDNRQTDGDQTDPDPAGTSIRMAPDLNAGSAALQYYFAQHEQGDAWLAALDVEQGYPALHRSMFGDPWERARSVEPLFPRGLAQPSLSLPFQRGWTWSFTGGPHGAWERDGAYAALDFAPGSVQSGCVKSNAWVTAAASGLVVRSGNGVVVTDLDGDGREQTGWVLVYLHVSTQDRVPVGKLVDQGEPLGHPSCEGGISTGTHVHIARKFNGEWIPADGPLPFNLGGWVAHAGSQAYLGTLTRGNDTITACTCANAASFITRGEDDP